MIEFTAPKITAPDGSIIGVIQTGEARLGPGDPMPDSVGNYILDHALSTADAITRLRSISRLLELRRAGATIVLISHDEPLLESCADEIWWIRDGELLARGDPSEVLLQYRRHVAAALRASGEGEIAALAPTMRTGDGRAVLESVDLTGESGEPATVFQSGETVTIGVTVRFASRVEDPVVGIMIRTRIGLNVYGTNTELERIKVGPVEPGALVRVTYRFTCDLCPGDYTVTAASHDPDGVWHDWLEDAVAFAVTDSRYTAGVANLRARVEVQGQSAKT
jgi:lipopolysaccharide transport system ATP-binding protein